jgi:hypothetical protein
VKGGRRPFCWGPWKELTSITGAVIDVSSHHLRAETEPVTETPFPFFQFLKFRKMDKVQNPSNSDFATYYNTISDLIYTKIKQKKYLQMDHKKTQFFLNQIKTTRSSVDENKSYSANSGYYQNFTNHI